MLLEDRKEYILKLLQERASVSVSELSEIFSISEVSVRKLLMTMESEGQLRRTWGGAVSSYGSLREPCHQEKVPKNLEEKKAIARAAYDCISDGDAIFIDCGTTTIQLVYLLKKQPKRNIMVATDGLNIAMELAGVAGMQVIMIGGEVRENVLSCSGSFAEQALKSLFFDKGFISGNHITFEHGFTTPTLQEAKLKSLMIAACKEHYLLLDSSKFGDDSLALIAPARALDTIITDWHAPAEDLRHLRENGVRVIEGQKVQDDANNTTEVNS